MAIFTFCNFFHFHFGNGSPGVSLNRLASPFQQYSLHFCSFMTGSIVRQISSSLGVQSSRTSSTFLGEMIVREWEENDDEKSGLLTSEDFPPRNTDSSSISMKKDEEKESVNKNSSKDVILWNLWNLWNLCIRWFFIQALPIFA